MALNNKDMSGDYNISPELGQLMANLGARTTIKQMFDAAVAQGYNPYVIEALLHSNVSAAAAEYRLSKHRVLTDALWSN